MNTSRTVIVLVLLNQKRYKNNKIICKVMFEGSSLDINY